jgi:hypothetical protein
MERLTMIFFFRLIISCALIAVGTFNATSQNVKLLADVDVSRPFILLYSEASVDGQYIACSKDDSIGVLRVRTYPTERRDTIAIPDSVTSVRCVCFLKDRLLLAYQSRATRLTHFATIDNDGTEWKSAPDVLPSVHPVYGKLDPFISSTVAPGQNTAALGGYYSTSTTPSKTAYLTTIINTQTLATLHTYDTVGPLKVSPGGREYYYTKMAPDSSAWLCLYFDVATGAWLRTVRSNWRYGSSTGIDHIMHTTRSIGSIDAEPVTMLPEDQSFVTCLASPNIMCVLRSTDTLQWIEAYDVLNGTSVLIDTIRAGVSVTVNDVDRLILVHTTLPFRFRVYSYDGYQGREGLACIRSVDSTLVFSNVNYSTVHLSRTPNAHVTAMIDRREYAMNGRTTPLTLRSDRLGWVPFSATARSAQGMVIDSMVRAPLIVRRPSAFTDAVQVRHGAAELALSADEQSLAVVSDSMTTVIPIISGPSPTLDTAHARIIRDVATHATQTPLLPSTSYVKTVLRDDDPNRQEYRRSLEQLVVRFNGDSTLLRSFALEPDVIIRKVQTVWSVTDSLLGLAVFTSNASAGRLYLSKRINGAWVLAGDTNGIKILNGDRVDISVPGLIMSTSAGGTLYVTNRSDGTVIFDTTDGRAHALLVDDTTLITSNRVWKLRDGTWQPQQFLGRNSYLNSDVIRVSASTSLLLRYDRNIIGYLVDHASAAVKDSLDNGFKNQRCAIYSNRYRGVFVGYYNGEVGFVPIDPKYLDPTSVAIEQSPRAPLGITSCTLYTVHGSRVAGLACTTALSATEVESLHIPSGLYIAVYTHEHGEPTSQLIVIEK